MNRLSWGGIAYAVWLGVDNWRRLQKLEEALQTNNRLIISAFGEVRRAIKT